MSQSTLALLSVPFVTGVIGYVTNWTGVLMLFYPVHFKGSGRGWLQSAVAHAALQAAADSRA